MNKDKKILYTVSLLILAALLVVFFADLGSSRIATACILLLLTAVTLIAVKKRSSLSINKKEVLLLSTIIGVIYVALVQMTGIVFGYYQNPYMVKTQEIFTVLLPIVVIIVGSELIRCVLLAQKNSFVSILAYLSCVIAETLAYSNLVGIKNFNIFMNFFGMTLFPAICANIYYHYAAKRYGAWPNVAFRLITTLYIYLMPQNTAMADALLACTKMILPIVMLALVSAMYEKKNKKAVRHGKVFSAIVTVMSVTFVVSVAMLISCQFRFGALVIATDSMTGEINRGDMILYERYEDQVIREGQIIVFTENRSKIIHRVIKVENIGGTTRYYTKGDANEDPDSGYRTDADIVGVTDVKISYVGYPTLWLQELLKGS